MELWIRSQDKRQLLKVNDGLYIANGFDDTDDTFIGIKNVGHIGRYVEEKRALEVLDEIQNLLQPKIKYIQEEPVESIVDFGYQIRQNVDMKI